MAIFAVPAALGAADYLFNEGKGTKAVGDFFGDLMTGGPKFHGEYNPYQVRQESYQLPNVGEREQQLGAYMQATQGQAPLTLDQALANQMRQEQLNQLGASRAGMADASQMLRAQAMGQGPSAAELQMKRGLEDAIATQTSQAASMRGVNPALAQRYAARGIAEAQQRSNLDAATLRAQEQAQAQQTYAGMQGDYASTLGGLLGGVRGQDLSAAGTDLQSALSQRALANQAQQFGLSGLMGMDQTQMQGQMSLDQAMADAYNRAEAARLGIDQANYQRSLVPYQAAWGAGSELVGQAVKAGLVA